MNAKQVYVASKTLASWKCQVHHHPRHYNPCRVLADSRSHLQPSLSLALILQFLTPSLSASLITPSIRGLAFPLAFCPPACPRWLSYMVNARFMGNYC
jgi:hypothetical protein